MPYIICYTQNGTDRFEETEDRAEWIASHPNADIEYVFNSRNNTLNYESRIESDFINFCKNFNFNQDDLNADFENIITGKRIRLCGMNTKNKKYIFIIHDYDRDENYKVTPGFFKDYRKIQTIMYSVNS